MPDSLVSTPPSANGLAKPVQLAALAILAALAVANHLTAGAIVREQESTTHVVNIVARQAALSQRISGLCVELASHSNLKRQAADPNQLPDQASDDAKDLSPEKAEDKTRDDLRQATALMEMAHQALINGSADLKLTKPTAIGITRVYFGEPHQLDHQVVYFLAAANAVADAKPEELNADNKSLIDVQLAARETLLAAENAAVAAYEVESAAEIAKMRRKLGLLLGAMLLAIAGEIALVWRQRVA